MLGEREAAQKPSVPSPLLEPRRPPSAIATFASALSSSASGSIPHSPSASPTPTSPSINSTHPPPRPVSPHSSSDDVQYRSASDASPVVFSSLAATPVETPVASPRMSQQPSVSSSPRRNSLDEYVHVESSPALPTSSSASSLPSFSSSTHLSPGLATRESDSPVPVRKWSFSSIFNAVQQATPTLPRVNVRKNLHSMSAWFSAQAARRDGGRGEDEDDGFTAQEGMEEQIDQSLLVTDGVYDVDHLDFTREQRRNYRFVTKRTAEARDAWFDAYQPLLEAQLKAWSGRDFTAMSELELRKLARKGIPAAFRSHIWAQAVHLDRIKQDSPGRYAELVAEEADVEVLRSIEKDLDRTFINHPAFHLSPMLLRLRRVLVAFARHNPRVGYCQSLNFLAGFLLLFYNEEDAFWLMATVTGVLLPSDYFTDSMLGLHADLNVLALLISTHLPRLHQHLRALNVDIRPIAFPWFLSIFVKTLPIESALRVWDSFVLEGSKVLFRTALALLSVNEEKLVRTTDFGRLYSLISVMGNSEFDCERLMAEAFAMRGVSRKTIDRMRRRERKNMEREMDAARRKAEAKAVAAATAAAAGGGGDPPADAPVKVGPSASDEDEGSWTEDEEDVVEAYAWGKRSAAERSEQAQAERHHEPPVNLPTAEPVASVALS